jgi:predicted acetyltransferase
LPGEELVTMIELERIGKSGDVILRNLYEHYVHDMSEWLGIDTHADGTYGHDTAPLWEGDFAVYLARVDAALAGFGVVGSAESWLGKSAARDVKDFFVLRRYRHRGVADALALHLWNEFPAEWIVRVLVANQPALSFWRRLVRGYRADAYEERLIVERGRDSVDRDWIHLRFDNARR